MDRRKIGQFIQEQRKKRELTQRDPADKLRVTNKAVSKREPGKSMPDVSLFEPLCRELEISIPELLAGHRIDEEDRQQSLIVRFTYAVFLFAMMAAIGYPAAVLAGAPAAAVILVFSIAFGLSVLIQLFIRRYQRKIRS